ncbi:M16 family metallopeptidase [Fulvivirga ligni]|uniref:M16 family metallopeptidase n=1 Tax=Fulvivirga ligni TaxID=2904246 RepID=UPI001F32F09A|nr:M16 family metallopeptidase [Fulvivirga ligni]UII19013.1 insulinase family protein [Fulvivirga ligni]
MNFELKACVFLLLALSFQKMTFAQKKDNTTFKEANITQGVLKNGLHYYIMHHEEPKERVSFYFAQNVGSILENDGQQGLAHFLEHMAFNGTEHYKDKEMLEYLEKNGIKFGSEINAFTSFDETVYNINKVPVQNEQLLDSVLLVLRDWSGGLLLTESEIDKERGVVMEEWRSRNTPRNRASEKIFKQGVLKGSKYENRMPIGQMEVVDNFEYGVLRDYYNRWYRPDQQAVVIVGDIDPKIIEKKVKDTFASIPLLKDLPERPTFDVAISKEFNYITATDKELGEPVIQYYIQHKANKSLSMKEEIQEDLKYQLSRYIFNLRLSEIARSEHSPVLSAGFGLSNFVRPLDVLSMTAQPKKDSLTAALEFTFTELKRFMVYGPAEAELSRAKAAFKTSLESSLKNIDKHSNDAYAHEIYNAFFEKQKVADREWNLNYRISYLESLHSDDLLSYLKSYYSTKGNIVAFTGSDKVEYPGKQEVVNIMNKVKKSALEPFKEELSDKKLIEQTLPVGEIVSTQDFEGINAKTYTLSNRARVTLFPTTFDKEKVFFQAYSPGGKSLLATKQLSNALVATSLASESGIGSMNKVELGKFLQGKQTSITLEIGDHGEAMAGESSLDDIETLMQRIYLAFTAPRFDEDAFGIIKQSLENSLTAKNNNVKSDFGDSVNLAQNNYSDRTVLFNKGLINDLSVDAMEQVYTDRFKNASDFDFIFVGDFENEKFLELIKTYIGNIPGDGSKERSVNHFMKPKTGITKVHLNRKMETPQTTVNIYLTGDLQYNKENRLILNIIGQLLGKRYLDRIREDEGGSYGVQAYGYMQNIPEDNFVISIGFNCNPKKAEQLTDIVYEEIKQLSNSLDSKELQEIKSNLKKGVVENRENNRYWLNKITSSIKNDLPLSTEEELISSIDAITEKDIKEVAAKINENTRVIEGVLNPVMN